MQPLRRALRSTPGGLTEGRMSPLDGGGWRCEEAARGAALKRGQKIRRLDSPIRNSLAPSAPSDTYAEEA
jgi:hypothetical protein